MGSAVAAQAELSTISAIREWQPCPFSGAALVSSHPFLFHLKLTDPPVSRQSFMIPLLM